MRPGDSSVPATVAAGIGVVMVLALAVASGAPEPMVAADRMTVAAPAVTAAAGAVAGAPMPPTPVAGTSVAATPSAAGTPSVAGSAGSATGAAMAGCDRSAARHRHGSVGGLVLGVAALLCDPLGPAAGLAPTRLEAEEPERLYALVTRERAVRPKRYAPDDLVMLPGDFYQARAEVADHLVALFAAAEEAGHHLSVTSGFRDHDTQAGTHEDWVRRMGPDHADKVSAQPGHSEHQLGLAVDVTGRCGGFDCFGDSPEGTWVAANAHRFGFIVRYPEGGQRVTGYAYEPWHLRYVGPRAAWAMHQRGEVYWERFAPVALEAATGR